MTTQERETAARFYERIATVANGSQSVLAARYNRERARFLRGEVDSIAGSARTLSVKRKAKIMFNFQEGQTVSLTADYAGAGLPVGSIGRVWAIYEGAPPAYEVTFSTPTGDLDLTLNETEVQAAVRKPISATNLRNVAGKKTLTTAR